MARPVQRFSLRIIGGEWRGRRIRFPRGSDVRPTPDRVRETVFNWLQSQVAGRRCLDLCAGSGALGLEALSRGAAEVVFVDADPAVAASLRETLGVLGAGDRGRVQRRDALAFLRAGATAGTPFDIVFLDPPYALRALPALAALLEREGWLRDGSLIYLEDAAAEGPPELPAGWTLLRSQRAGDVGYHLAIRHAKTGT